MAAKTHSRSSVSRTVSGVPQSAKQLDAEVRRALNAAGGLNIGSLVVRKLPNGICLEGVIRVSSDDFDARGGMFVLGPCPVRALRIEGLGQTESLLEIVEIVSKPW